MNTVRLAREQQPATADQHLDQFGGILSFPTAKQHYYVGGTYTLLGEYKEAERYAQEAISAYENGPAHERSYGDEALARIDVVKSRIATNQLEGAAEELTRILSMPADLRIRQLAAPPSSTSPTTSRAPATSAPGSS
ncbi:hypothetical protein ACFVWY_32760 [Streptomyces sp. NPDC058195]|uniref:hypothetical protein n=1 Tax=Streptomyces sp. NPDC058195 TaxID=3346375 RepID=UPI0036EC52F7